jgi:hypothetical protein
MTYRDREEEFSAWLEDELEKRLEAYAGQDVPLALLVDVISHQLLPMLIERGRLVLSVRQGVEVESAKLTVTDSRP